VWKKVFVSDYDNVEDAYVTVSILTEEDNKEIGKAQFNVAAILGSRQHAVYEDLEDGSTIFVCAHEHKIERSTFKFKIRGKDLIYKSKTRLIGGKPDPFYEVRNASGIVYRSEVQDRTMDPDWLVAEVDLYSLCGGNFDAPVELVVFDHHRHETGSLVRTSKSNDTGKLIGLLKSTVNNLLLDAESGECLLLSQHGQRAGNIFVLEAECIGLISTSEALQAAATAKAVTEASQVAEMSRKEFEKARGLAEATRKSEQEAFAALDKARIAAEVAKTASLEAAKEEERIKKRLVGTLRFQFEGKSLKNVEAFTLFDKSDPFFVLQKITSQENEKVDWSHVYISGVIMNNLNPAWEVSEVNIGDICDRSIDEAIRVVVFDWEKSGKHKLIGYFETSIQGIMSAQRSEEEFQVADKFEETGRIAVRRAELDGFIDPKSVEKRAKELAEKADAAHFFALGAEQRVKHASKAAESARKKLLQLEIADWTKNDAVVARSA